MDNLLNELDGLLHEARARCKTKQDRKILKAILKEQLRILEWDEFETKLKSERDPWVLSLEDVSLKLEDQDLHLKPGETLKLEKVDLERTPEGELVIELPEQKVILKKNKVNKK